MLADMIFFHPKENFLKWIKDNCGNDFIYDVGCGNGLVTKTLLDLGIITIGIDINERENPEYENIIIADATDWTYREDSVILICRPCGGWFIEDVIKKGIQCKAKSIIYVTKPYNKKIHLGDYGKKFKKVLGSAGKDRENVFEWKL